MRDHIRFCGEGGEATDISMKGLPRELRSFFLAPGGHSLILRGNAGTGKTTFALQMIEELDEIDNSFYFSTRVSDSLLLTQFPWLARKVYGESVGDSVRAEVQAMEAEGRKQENAGDGPDEVPSRQWFNKLKLRGTFGFEAKAGQAFPQNRVDLAELERIYSAIEGCAGQRIMVVVDSADALAEACGINQATVITAIQKDLVEGRKADIIFLLESNDRYLDYLGDGVVELSILEHHRRRLREMSILKARGCAISQPKYLFTLDGARIRAFLDQPGATPQVLKGWRPIPDGHGKVSLGLADLDRLMGGGISPGSILLIELGHNVPIGICHLLEQTMVANFAAQRRGVLWVPMRKEPAEAARARLANAIGKEAFDRSVRIPEVSSQVEDASAHYILPVEGEDAAADLKWKTVSFALREASSPQLSIMGFDTLESVYGPKAVDQMADHLTAVKRNRGIFIGLVSPSTSSTEKLADLATQHLMVDRIGGTVVLYGVEPYTECNALAVVEGRDETLIDLVPIV